MRKSLLVVLLVSMMCVNATIQFNMSVPFPIENALTKKGLS